MKQEEYSKDSRLITAHYAEEYENYYNAIVPPIFMNSLNVFSSVDEFYDSDTDDKHIYCYGRVQNPTVRILEDKLAALEHGNRAFIFASGMAAATTAVMSICHAGSSIVCVSNAYEPLNIFLTQYCAEHFQMNISFIKGEDLQEFEDAVTDDTDLIILESPSSLVMRLQDIEGVVKIAKKHNAKTYIDNTYCTPIYQNPLDMGIDIVMHTMSKYIGGHSDIIGGVLIAKDEKLLKKISFLRELYGGIIGPMEAWLALRGLRTLEVRLKQHERIADEVAKFLENHPKIKKVYYPGLESFSQYELMKKQQRGNCGLMSFEITGTTEQAKLICESTSIFKIGVSWGGFESLIEMPFLRKTQQELEMYGAPRNLIRIHCGLEGAEILIQDLEKALSTM